MLAEGGSYGARRRGAPCSVGVAYREGWGPGMYWRKPDVGERPGNSFRPSLICKKPFR